VFNENLQYEMAKGYLLINNKEKAKTLLEEIMKKEPSFSQAKKLLDEIK
jgi:Tfp pilus assembly protein PilF